MITYKFFGGIADGIEANISGFFQKMPPGCLWVEHDPLQRGTNGFTANIQGRGCPYRLVSGGNEFAVYEVFLNPGNESFLISEYLEEKSVA